MRQLKASRAALRGSAAKADKRLLRKLDASLNRFKQKLEAQTSKTQHQPLQQPYVPKKKIGIRLVSSLPPTSLSLASPPPPPPPPPPPAAPATALPTTDGVLASMNVPQYEPEAPPTDPVWDAAAASYAAVEADVKASAEVCAKLRQSAELDATRQKLEAFESALESVTGSVAGPESDPPPQKSVTFSVTPDVIELPPPPPPSSALPPLCEDDDDTPVGGVEETKSAERVPSPSPDRALVTTSVPTSVPTVTVETEATEVSDATQPPPPKRVAFPPDVAASMSGSSTDGVPNTRDAKPGASRTVRLTKVDNSTNAVKPGMSRDEAAAIWRSWSAMRRSKTNVTRLKLFCTATGIEYTTPKSRTVAALNQELK